MHNLQANGLNFRIARLDNMGQEFCARLQTVAKQNWVLSGTYLANYAKQNIGQKPV